MTRWTKFVAILAAHMIFIILAVPIKTYGDEKPVPQVVNPVQKEKTYPASTRAFSRRLGFGIAVDINLTVSPVAGTNPCPTDFILKGRIFVNKPTTLQYKFVRSDDKTTEPVTLTFDKPGAMDVTDTFRAANTPSASESWALMETVSPVNVKTRSNTVFFGGSCEGGRVMQKGRLQQDCVFFDPGEVTVRQEQHTWKVGDRVHTLFTFDVDKTEAENSLAIIKHYKMNRSCFVGRPKPSFHYMLTGDSSPAGAFKGESCRPFDPTTTNVRQTGKNWSLGDSTQTLIDFGNRRADADQALAVIRKYGFTHFCAMATGKVDFVYMRR